MIIQMEMSIRLALQERESALIVFPLLEGGWSIGQELKHSIGQGMASKDFYLAPLRAATNFKAGDTGHQEE